MKTQAELVKNFVQRIEHVEDEETELKDAKKDLYDEAKTKGLDPKVLREVIKRRKKNQAELDALEDAVSEYMGAVE